jgi:hypothetical protein
LSQVDSDGTVTRLETVDVEVSLQTPFDVSKPYPNPFRGRATMDVTVREAQEVTVDVYNVLGQRVRTLYRGQIEANDTKQLQLNGRRLSSGLYFVRVRGEDFSVHRRAMLVR